MDYPSAWTWAVPLLVNNNGSGIGLDPNGTLTDKPSRFTIDPNKSAWARLGAGGVRVLFPEGRGYGGSEGPDSLETAWRGGDATFEMLAGRAAAAGAAAWQCVPGRLGVAGAAVCYAA